MKNTAFDATGREIHIGDKVIRAQIALGVIKWNFCTVVDICPKKIRVDDGHKEINATPGNCVIIDNR